MRAQIIGQIFLYILAIVLVSIILLFGYKAITNFKEKTEQIAYITMKNELTNAVKTITIDYGSVIKKELNIPGNYKEVCFVNTYEELPSATEIPDSYPIIQQSVNSKVNKNVFLVADIAEQPFDIGEITVGSEPILCIPVKNGRIVLRLEGKGNHADISEWQS